MNCYLISYLGRRYATDADNMLEAEEKFIETYGGDSDDFRITQVDVTSVRNDESIVFF